MHSLHPLGVLVVVAAGFAAGTINSIVGSGSLITFPTLVALGVPPLVANVSNTVGIVFGNASSVHGYRRELSGQSSRMQALVPLSAAGGLTGAVLLLLRPAAFHAIVPWLIIIAVVLVIIQPRVARSLADRGERHPHGGILLKATLFATAIYGGYFGAAQGVILIAILAIGLDETLQRINALKNVFGFTANLVAAIVFVIFGPVNWTFVLFIGLSSIVGGQFGAKIGRRMPAPVLRAIIVIAGLAVAIKLLV